jgi:ABC-type uncharacterized transport system permease subunit
MIDKISITCFAASYAVALALEVSRLFFRSGVRGALLLGFAGAGFIAQTLFLGYRAMETGSTPLSSEFAWYLVASWTLVGAYLYLTLYYPRTPVGILILPLVLGLIGVAHFTAGREPFVQSRAALIWGTIHGVFLLLGAVAITIGFVSGVLYLWHSYRLKNKLPQLARFQLPSLEQLERINAQAIVFSVWMLATGLLSGMVLNLVNHRLEKDHFPWSDPVVWSFGLLVLWTAVVALFSAIYRPARQGRKVAYLTVGNFICLVLFLGARTVVESDHGSGKPVPAPPAPNQTSLPQGALWLAATPCHGERA